MKNRLILLFLTILTTTINCFGERPKSTPVDSTFINRTDSIKATENVSVDLLTFSTEVKDNVVYLNWKTKTEVNNDYFTIERSKNGIDFSPLKDISGSGKSGFVTNYMTEDDDPFAGISYYRLKQTNFDGQSSVVAMTGVEVKEAGLCSLFILPGSNEMNLVINSQTEDELVVTITDSNAKSVYSEKIKVSNQRIVSMPKGVLGKGVYYVQAVSDKKIITGTINIQ